MALPLVEAGGTGCENRIQDPLRPEEMKYLTFLNDMRKRNLDLRNSITGMTGSISRKRLAMM